MGQRQRFAMATKPRQEHLAEVSLKRQGYSAVLPLMEARKRRQNKWKLVTKPLFSGYLFVRLEVNKNNLAPIRSMLGCRDLLRVGPGLVLVPDAVMTPLLLLSSLPKTSEVLFSEGDEISISAGASSGLQGVFKLASRSRGGACPA